MASGKTGNTRLKTTVFVVSCVIIVGGLLLLPYLIHYYFSPDELIRNTTASLERLTGTTIKIRDVKLSLLDGITFHGVQAFVPAPKMKLEPALSPEDALLLRADTFHIKLRRRGFLGLNFGIASLTVSHPEVNLTRTSGDGHWNWQLVYGGTTTGPVRKHVFKLGPPLVLNDAIIRWSETRNGKKVPLGKMYLSVQAVPDFQRGFYRLTASSRTDRGPGPSAQIDVVPSTSEILAGRIDPIDLRSIEPVIPESTRIWFRKLDLGGKVGVPEMEHKPGERTRITLALENTRINLPTTRAELDNPTGRALFRLSNLNGQVLVTQKELILPKLTGQLNDTSVQINGTCQDYATPFDRVGFHLTVMGQDLLLPDYNEPKSKDFIETYFHKIGACFFRDYKPRGRVDFKVLLSRGTESGAKVRVSGAVQPRKLSAEYFRFPYRLDDITGTVRLADGGFELIGVTGVSGSTKVTVNGTISEPTSRAAIHLDIQSAQVPLDLKLFGALPGPYQALWKKFDLGGAADMQIRLDRPQGPNHPWGRRITASFRRASGTYEGFKFPLHDLTGSFQFENDQVVLRNLTGHNGFGRVTINGTVLHPDEKSPEVQLSLHARNISINEDLIRLLGPQPGRILRDCRLAGTTDLAGTITSGPDRPLGYRFECELKNSSMCHRDFPYPVDNLSGQLVVTAGKVAINGVTAKKGLQTITGTGKFHFDKDGTRSAFKIDANQLNVDSVLYQALDPIQKAVWDLLHPTGKLNVHAEFNRDQGKGWDWQLDVGLAKTAVQYKSTAPIRDLEGTIRFRPGEVRLSGLAGKVRGQWPMAAEGSVVTADNVTTVSLSRLNLEGVDLCTEVLATLGVSGRMKDLRWQPGGTLSADLENLGVVIDSSGGQSWRLAGKLGFNGARILAFDTEPVDFGYTGGLSWTASNGDFALDGSCTLSSFNSGSREVHGLSANMAKKPGDPSLRITQLRGRYAEGQVSGTVDLGFGPKATTYGVQLTLDHLDAATALKVTPRNGSIRGTMRGDLFMLGELGQKYARRGGGSFQIDGAEALKVPLMAKIHETVNKEPPNLASFHNITVEFLVEKHRVTLQQLELTGPGLSMLGTGTLNLSNDRIGLNLIAAAPKSLNGVPLLQDLVQGTGGEILQLDVRGSVNQPTITAQPLKNVSEAFQTFIKGRDLK